MLEIICDSTCDIPQDMIDILVELIDGGFDEQAVVVVFLYLLTQEKQIKNRLARSTKRIIAKAYKQAPAVSDVMQKRIKEAIESYLQTI